MRNENAAEVGSARIRCMNGVREREEITDLWGVYALDCSWIKAGYECEPIAS